MAERPKPTIQVTVDHPAIFGASPDPAALPETRAEEIRARRAEISQTPWCLDERFPRMVYCDNSLGSIVADCDAESFGSLSIAAKNANAEFVVHAPDDIRALLDDRDRLLRRVEELEPKAAAYDRVNTPELFDFVSAVHNEALHQRERWGVDDDGGKTDADWFWLIGYLAGKALHNPAKDEMEPVSARLHRIITIAAAAANWHATTLGVYARMRPGIASPAVQSP